MGFFKGLWEFGVRLLSIPVYEASIQKPLHLFPEVERPASFPQPQGCVNSPQNRSCWVPGFDINTDYETSSGVPPGVLRPVSKTQRIYDRTYY
jgi:hypothetical protein